MGIFALSLGAFTNEQRDAIMRRSSMTYLEMKWVDSILPADAKVIISSRFMATAPRYAIASDWKSYVPKEHEVHPLEIKAKPFGHIMTPANLFFWQTNLSLTTSVKELRFS
jgi:hypothetical protein